jgi:hypothetical protein
MFSTIISRALKQHQQQSKRICSENTLNPHYPPQGKMFENSSKGDVTFKLNINNKIPSQELQFQLKMAASSQK